jgi:hypothetical protein
MKASGSRPFWCLLPKHFPRLKHLRNTFLLCSARLLPFRLSFIERSLFLPFEVLAQRPQAPTPVSHVLLFLLYSLASLLRHTRKYVWKYAEVHHFLRGGTESPTRKYESPYAEVHELPAPIHAPLWTTSYAEVRKREQAIASQISRKNLFGSLKFAVRNAHSYAEVRSHARQG